MEDWLEIALDIAGDVVEALLESDHRPRTLKRFLGGLAIVAAGGLVAFLGAMAIQPGPLWRRAACGGGALLLTVLGAVWLEHLPKRKGGKMR